MLIAIDQNNRRIHPKKGALGICPYCKKDVKAFCGDINIDHWRHVVRDDCDSWKEAETDWHRSWKMRFPEEWREVILKKNGETHIADIKTKNGLVLEIQNSSISVSTIAIREEFYEEMVWLINAKKFKSNFQLWSMVKVKLQELEAIYYGSHSYSNYYTTEDSEAMRNLVSVRNTLENKIRNKQSNLKSRLKEIQVLSNVDVNKEIDYLIKNCSIYIDFLWRDFKSDKINLVNESRDLKTSLETKAKDIQNNLDSILNLEKCGIQGYENYRFVSAESIPPKLYDRCAQVEDSSISTLLPNVRNFLSEMDYKMTSKRTGYSVIIDITKSVSSSEKQIKDITEQIQNAIQSENQFFEYCKNDFQGYIENKKDLFTKETETIYSHLKNLAEELRQNDKKIADLEREESRQREEEEVEDNKRYEGERYQIMKKFKGLYGYRWKHRRKSWDFSKKPIYLDFGTQMFRIVSDKELKKISTQDFIQKIKSYEPLL